MTQSNPLGFRGNQRLQKAAPLGDAIHLQVPNSSALCVGNELLKSLGTHRPNPKDASLLAQDDRKARRIHFKSVQA